MHEVVPIKPVSDGDPSHLPTKPNFHCDDPSYIYLEKIGKLWMQERGEAQPGVEYILDKLPDGYSVWGRPRLKEPTHVDRWLYGHPGHHTFDSPNRFFPHFLHLMNNDGSNAGCPCTVCNMRGGKVPNLGASVKVTPARRISILGTVLRQPARAPASIPVPAKRRGRPPGWRPMDSRRVDDEGTPDVFRDLIDKLHKDRFVDEPIKEPYSMDWRAERKVLPDMLRRISKQPSWLPRLGELVLFVRKLEEREEICFEEVSQEYKIYNLDNRQFRGHPRWEAGVIAQVNAEKVEITDLVKESSDKEYQVNYSGFRVEPLPDPNSDEKPCSKQYKYVPLHYTRPFIFWSELLQGILEASYHPTIKHAFTVTSTFSLIEKYHFKGHWPNATIYNRGIYIGSELLLVGDVVRLTPPPRQNSATITDVLHITSIKLVLSNLDKASDNDRDDGHPYNSTVHVVGKAYTLDPMRSVSDTPLPETALPTDMHGYPPWYPRHDLSKSYTTTFSRIVGRLHNVEALLLWFPGPERPRGSSKTASPSSSFNTMSRPNDTTATAVNSAHPDRDAEHDDYVPDISLGLSGLLSARAYAQSHDRRIRVGAKWFWGDSRADALDLETVNGVEVARYDYERDAKRWRRGIRVLEGAKEAEKVAGLDEGGRAGGLKRGSEVVQGNRAEANESGDRGESSRSGSRSETVGEESEEVGRKRSWVPVNEGSGIELDGDEMDVDQFVDELAGGFEFDGNGNGEGEDEEDEDEECVVVEERSTPKKQRLLVVID